MIRRPPRSTQSRSSAASDVYKRQILSYKIDRSTDGSTWTNVTTTNGNAYLDTVSESRKYYWRVGTMDNLSLIHISEPTRLLSISYAVFCLKKKTKTKQNKKYNTPKKT